VSVPAWPGYKALPCRSEPKWDAIKADRIPDPIPNEPVSLNGWVNQAIVYKPDRVDHWQGPAETLRLGTGDCEDLAILKRAVLLARGWPRDRLFVVIGHDLVARSDHAVLLAGETVWDCRADGLIKPAELSSVFLPRFAYGEGSWVFGKHIPPA
jgi:predicted transglutaminase-like cysteine proteinase